MRALALLTLISTLPLTSCRVQDEDMIGRFEVTWTRTEACGETGILASPPTMVVRVALRQSSESSLQWVDRGETNVLQNAGDGSYSAALLQVVDMRAGVEGAENLPPCSVERLDTLTAHLKQRANGELDEFTADLGFDYAATADSQCGDLMTPEGIAGGLPCAIAYEGVAVRVLED